MPPILTSNEKERRTALNKEMTKYDKILSDNMNEITLQQYFEFEFEYLFKCHKGIISWQLHFYKT